MRASAGTGPADGSMSHSRRCTSSDVSGSRTAASAARRPTSPVSDLSAASFDVAAAGSPAPTASVRVVGSACGCGPAALSAGRARRQTAPSPST
eukprot:2075036-Pleurochrysis_carterae.AAC.2